MGRLAIEIIKNCIETQDPCLDLGMLGLWDADFSWGSKLDNLLSRCTHLRILVLGNHWKNPLKPDLQHKKVITVETGLNCFSTPPSAIKKLKNLTELIMPGGGSVVWSIKNLDFLKRLYLLEKIDLSYNKIRNIQGLERLHFVKELWLGNNQIPEIINLEELSQLEILNLENNKIKKISGLEKLAFLKNLNLSNNELLEISGIETLQLLQRLVLSNNSISTISGLEKNEQLKELNLSGNNIINIERIDSLRHLQHLDLRFNNIADISPLWAFLKKTQNPIKVSANENHRYGSILVKGNPITSPPPEVLQRGHDAVLEYIEAANKKGFQPLNECKVIIVGDGGVGKTSLLKRLVFNDFNHKEPTTHGINKIAWKGITNNKGEKITVNLWDFGGQHLQHSLHQFFLSKRVLYILVLSPRSMNNAAYWMGQIEKLGGNSPVLVVYNIHHEKDIEASFETEYYELKKKYKQLNNEYYVISCDTGKGMENFKTALNSTIIAKPDLNTPYPVNWYNIKNAIEEKVKLRQDNFYVHYDEYRKICIANDYLDPERQKGLLVQLDDIGSIVFFDREDVNHLQVLNPEWITTGAYSILTSPITRKNNGYLTIQDLRKIFEEEKTIFSDSKIKIKYEEHHFKYIIDLMQHYNLCQKNPFDSNQNSYLIPAALTGLPIIDFNKYKNESKHYRFQFDVAFEMMLIHRFIARNLHKAREKDFWQSGILIKDDRSNTWALVETDQHSKFINFWISGSDIRGLWESIRRDMHELCKIYQNLHIEETIFYDKKGIKAFLAYEMLIDYMYSDGDIHNTPIRIPGYGVVKIDILEVLENFKSKNFIMEKLEQIREQMASEFSISHSTINNLENKISVQNHRIIEIIDLQKENKDFLNNMLIKIDNNFTNENAAEKLKQIEAAVNAQYSSLPSSIITQWSALNQKANDGVDIKAKLKLKLPIIPFLLEYEGEWSIDAKKLGKKLSGILL